MKKSGVYLAATAGATAVSMAFLGTGVAAADVPDYHGKTYGDVSKALKDAKLKAVVANRFGDTLPDDQCLVTYAQKAPWIKGDSFTAVSDTVLVYLNCNAGVATAKDPGNSVASPEGKAAIQKAEQDKEKAAASGG